MPALDWDNFVQSVYSFCIAYSLFLQEKETFLIDLDEAN